MLLPPRRRHAILLAVLLLIALAAWWQGGERYIYARQADLVAFAGDQCRRCGEVFVADPAPHTAVSEWIDRLQNGYVGCVALPAPAVPHEPERNLPRVSGENA